MSEGDPGSFRIPTDPRNPSCFPPPLPHCSDLSQRKQREPGPGRSDHLVSLPSPLSRPTPQFQAQGRFSHESNPAAGRPGRSSPAAEPHSTAGPPGCPGHSAPAPRHSFQGPRRAPGRWQHSHAAALASAKARSIVVGPDEIHNSQHISTGLSIERHQTCWMGRWMMDA